MSRAAGVLTGPFGRVALLDVEGPVLRHAHPHAHLLVKIGGADSFFRVGDRLLPLADGTAVMVNSWEPHDYPHARTAPRSLILALYIELPWLTEVDGSFQAAAAPRFFPHSCVALPRGLRTLFHDVAGAATAAEAAMTQSSAHEALLAGLLCRVIDQFSDWRRLRSANWPQQSLLLQARDFRIRRALAFMARHAGDVAMGEVAKASALSRAHFFELFKANLGLSPQVYCNTLRMEAAYRALLGPDQTLARIADQLRFAAPAHFTRFFREHFGVPPSEFRRVLNGRRAHAGMG